MTPADDARDVTWSAVLLFCLCLVVVALALIWVLP